MDDPASNHGILLLVPASASYSGARTLQSSDHWNTGDAAQAGDHLRTHPAHPDADTHAYCHTDQHADTHGNAYPHAGGRQHRRIRV